MSSLLSSLSNLKKATNDNSRTPMTPQQVIDCKAAIRRDNRGYNVQPNPFDVKTPYRVSVNFSGDTGSIPVSKNGWYNFGNFKSADVAAAVGTIISAGFFKDAAVAGMFDAEKVEKSAEYTEWLADVRNAPIIAMATGTSPPTQPDADDEYAF